MASAPAKPGLTSGPVKGGRELRTFAGTVDRRYRIRRGVRRSDGSLSIPINSNSALATEEVSSLFGLEQWVFAWTLSPDYYIGEVLVAKVIGYATGTPGYLILDNLIPLGTGDLTPPGSFQPKSEGLDYFDDDEGFEDDEGLGF